MIILTETKIEKIYTIIAFYVCKLSRGSTVLCEDICFCTLSQALDRINVHKNLTV